MEKHFAPKGKLAYINSMGGIEEVYWRVLFAVNGGKIEVEVCQVCLEKGEIEVELRNL